MAWKNRGVDPDALSAANPVRNMRGANRSELAPHSIVMYDVVYSAFEQDARFWKEWKVVHAERYGPLQGGNSIRVVMDLSFGEIYPTAYSTGESVRPQDDVRHDHILGSSVSPPSAASSVTLDVYLLSYAMNLLKIHDTKPGNISPDKLWLVKVAAKLREAEHRENVSLGLLTTAANLPLADHLPAALRMHGTSGPSSEHRFLDASTMEMRGTEHNPLRKPESIRTPADWGPVPESIRK
mmetsp:Transcript_10350/g.26340  ORF Transcript_10350/g.26340 Transcript_10350/m.26340 type:complete len:239 (-) Transcript_10350:136-852(-)